jgi:signal transduction histidine kinase/CheY-like chemotaxis protein/HPt (histidine-containing phosphotransfer) domain-containing protein
VVRLAPLALLGVLGLSFLILAATGRPLFRWQDGELPLLVVALWALGHGGWRTGGPGERRFWGFIAAAMLLWLVAEILQRAPAGWRDHSDLSNDFLYLLFFILFIFAAESRPERGLRPPYMTWLRRIELVSAVIFVFGLLFYFVLIPRYLGGEAVASWLASAYMYLVLDLYLVCRFLVLSRLSVVPRWRGIHGFLALTACCWLVADLLGYVAELAGFEAAVTVDLFWHLSFVPFVLAARLRHIYAPAGGSRDLPAPPAPESRSWLPVVGYTFFLPFLHVLLYSLDLVNPALERSRSVLILVHLVILGGLVLLQLWVQEKVTRTLQEERRQVLAEKVRADNANLAKSRFMADVSHDLRTPLNGILGTARILLKADLPPRERRHVEILSSTADGLHRLIDDVFDYLRIDAGELRLERAEVAPREIAEEVVQRLAPCAEIRGIGLRLEVEAGVPERLCGDPARLRQVLCNLAEHVLRLTRDGEVVVRVSGGDDVEGGSVRIRFAVRGGGLAASEARRLFSHLATPPSPRRLAGTGLGLVCCARLVALMGGGISVEGGGGDGATLRLEVPFDRPQTPAAGVTSSPGRRRGDCRILVVDDEWVNRVVAVHQLEDLGYRADSAGDGLEALETLERERYDAVLMDCHMSEIDGWETTRAIRARERGRRLPIVAVTAADLEETRERSFAAGMDDFFAKPYREDELAAALDRLLEIAPRERPAVAESSGVVAAPTVRLDAATVEELRRLGRESGDGFFGQIVGYFLEQTPNLLAEMERARSAGNGRVLAEAAHSLKGSASTLGAFGLAKICGRLHLLARDGELQRCPALLEEAQEESDRVASELRSLLAAEVG